MRLHKNLYWLSHFDVLHRIGPCEHISDLSGDHRICSLIPGCQLRRITNHSIRIVYFQRSIKCILIHGIKIYRNRYIIRRHFKGIIRIRTRDLFHRRFCGHSIIRCHGDCNTGNIAGFINVEIHDNSTGQVIQFPCAIRRQTQGIHCSIAVAHGHNIAPVIICRPIL